VLDQGERKKTVGRLHPREDKLVVETRAPEGSLAELDFRRQRRDGRGIERWWRRPVLWACGLGYAWMFDSSNWQLLG